MNILLCGNKKVFDGVLSLLISIANKTKEAINCYIFTMDLSSKNKDFLPIEDKQIEFLDKVLKEKNANNSVKKIDVTNLYKKEFEGCVNENTKYTPYAFLRLFADSIEDVDKLLYLDIDMMANDDISILYNIDITDYEYGAVREKYGKYLIRPDYINSGMMLFNMKKARENKLFEKARNILKSKKLLFADQSAIFLATTKKKLLNRRFNEQAKFNRKQTVICHFAKRLLLYPKFGITNYKQWNIDQIHKYYNCYTFDKDLDEYKKYKAKYESRED